MPRVPDVHIFYRLTTFEVHSMGHYVWYSQRGVLQYRWMDSGGPRFWFQTPVIKMSYYDDFAATYVRYGEASRRLAWRTRSA